VEGAETTGGLRRVPRTLPEILEAYERLIILKAIGSCGGSRAGAARSLGIRRGYFYSRVRHLGIRLDEIPTKTGRSRKEDV
jgi:DNA-binding NtrC family response regulator